MTASWPGAAVVVTGGSSGIGLACVDVLAAAGASVLVADVAPCPSDRRDAVAFVETDVSDSGAVAEAMRHLRPDVPSYAVNCAGVGGPTVPLVDLDDADWRRVIDVNLTGTFHCLREQLRRMAPGSAVVNIGSVLSLRGDADASSAYVASKFAVAGLTSMAALQGGPRGVRVNAVAPGRIRTPLLESVAGPEVLARRAAENPMGRLGESAEVGEAVKWLLGPESSYVNGSVVPVDGGFLAG